MPTDPDDRVSRITDLLQESSMGRWSFVNQCFLNDTMYLGHIPENDVPMPGLSYILINKTSQAVLSHAQIQVETRPRVAVSARQTSAEPSYYMTRKSLAAIRNAIDQNMLPAFEEVTPPEDEILINTVSDQMDIVESEGFAFGVMDESNAMAFEVTKAFIDRVMPLTQPWVTMDGVQANPLIKPEDIITIDDSVAASAIQNNLDISWEYDDRDLWLRNNIVNTLKFGTQGAAFVFDKETRKSHVFDIHLLNLFLPPNCTGVRDAEYVIVREIVSSKEAKERFPYAKSEIEEYQQRGTNSMTTLSGSMGEQAPYQGQYFGRNMVEIWHVWLRNERFPMSPDDAIDNGKVVMKGDRFYLTDEDYNITDEVVEVDKGKWPKKLGIRYQQMVGNTIVYDDECGHCDIPVVLNQNVPVSYSPWHQGEPERLWFVQKLIDKIASIIIDHITYFRSPQQILPATVYKRLKGLNSVYSHPGKDAWIDDGTFENYREFFASGRGFYIQPPNMPDRYVDLWQLAMNLFDEISGHSGVLQGHSPGANSSGKLVQELQNAARATISFKAASTEAMLKNLAKLEIDAWAKWMPLFMWAKANDQYPPEVLAAIRERSRDMEFTVSVEVSSGGGENRKQRQAQAFEEVGAGLRSQESYRRVAEIDDDNEWVEQKQQAQQQAQQPQGVPIQ